MKIYIIHDSKRGNSKFLSKILGKAFEGEQVFIEHYNDISYETVAKDRPDVILLGNTIRKLNINRTSTKWVKKLHNELRRNGHTIKYGACFITHDNDNDKINKNADKFIELVNSGDTIETVNPNWISAKIKGKRGFEEEVIKKVTENSNSIANWVKNTSQLSK